jgi:hypothetical protein
MSGRLDNLVAQGEALRREKSLIDLQSPFRQFLQCDQRKTLACIGLAIARNTIPFSS